MLHWSTMKYFCHIVCYRTVVLQVLWALALDQNQVQILYRHIQRWTDHGWSSNSLCCYCMPTSVNDDSKSWARLRRHVSYHIARQWRMCSIICLSVRMESHAVVGINTNQQLALIHSSSITTTRMKPNCNIIVWYSFLHIIINSQNLHVNAAIAITFEHNITTSAITLAFQGHFNVTTIFVFWQLDKPYKIAIIWLTCSLRLRSAHVSKNWNYGTGTLSFGDPTASNTMWLVVFGRSQ